MYIKKKTILSINCFKLPKEIPLLIYIKTIIPNLYIWRLPLQEYYKRWNKDNPFLWKWILFCNMYSRQSDASSLSQDVIWYSLLCFTISTQLCCIPHMQSPRSPVICPRKCSDAYVRMCSNNIHIYAWSLMMHNVNINEWNN